MEKEIEKDEIFPSLFYGADATGKPKPILVDGSGRLIISGQQPTTPQISGSGSSGGLAVPQKIETCVYPVTTKTGAVTTVSLEIETNARTISLHLDLLTAAGNFTMDVQTRNKDSAAFVTLISTGALPSAASYELDTTIYAKRFRLSFTLASAGTYKWAVYMTEGF